MNGVSLQAGLFNNATREVIPATYSLFDSKWIDSVEEYAKIFNKKKLVIQDGKQTERDSTGCFFTNDWLQKDLANVINETNKVCNWNFKLTKFEDFQYTSYDKKQHYNWHTDTHSKLIEMV